MTFILPQVFHWSPTERRLEILKEGLVPYSRPVTHTGDLTWPYICFGFTPSGAWGLSGGMEWSSEIEEWDLWQVQLSEGDECHIRPEFSNEFQEIKVKNAIPADRLWYVATREPFAAREDKDGEEKTTAGAA